jgi:hypothetical protein
MNNNFSNNLFDNDFQNLKIQKKIQNSKKLKFLFELMQLKNLSILSREIDQF